MDAGVIFSFDPSTSAYRKLKDFDRINGGYPSGSLMQASDGKLYGMTQFGGNSGAGVIFSFDPSSSVYAKLYDFDNSDGGANPSGSLIQLSDGKLYGMTPQGGSIGSGVIFSFDPVAGTYIKLKDFDNTGGSFPSGSLTLGSDGRLYGITTHGGNSDVGVIFSFDPSAGTYTKLEDFDDTKGAYPYGILIQARDGKLYGMTAGGGINGFGVIFSFDPSDRTYTKLKDFDNTNGAHPYGSLIQASDGKLYGTTYAGGGSSLGVIFSFDISTETYTKLKDFDNMDGAYPYGSLMEASDGNLYGMTLGGGSSGNGVIFSFDPSAGTYKELKDFGTNESGLNPSGSLTKASDGKLYGMTISGGSRNLGVIFSFNPTTGIYTKLMDFDYTNGANPYGSLMQANDGKLYGMTPFGGSNSYGVIFSFDPVSLIYTKLVDFDNTNGGYPEGNLMQASNGKLYGMTSAGGINGFGVIFSFDPSSSTYTKLKDFNYTYTDDFNDTNGDGAYPYGSIMQASDGMLYGMTTYGGTGNVIKGGSGIGIIFSIDPSSSTYTKLKDFDYANGYYPYGNLMQAGDGLLYGMTNSGGTGDMGVIFSFDPSSSVYTTRTDFDFTDGAYPFGNLIQAHDGKIYGMTNGGGSSDVGVIFSYDPLTFTFTKLKDFDYTIGAHPYYGAAFIEVPESGPLPVNLVSLTGKCNGSINQLSWKVDNEQDLNYYELQRSNTGQNFKGIYQIKAAGNMSYTYNDPVAAAVSSLNYYRLKSVNKDGGFKYSMVIKIRTDLTGFAVVKPNPFKNSLVIHVESGIQDKAIFIVTDISGKQFYKVNKLLSPGTNVVEIDETGRLSKGIYLLTIITAQQTQSIKVVKGN
jgi:uncharacterized repeat protein (TIGR03803 family)